MKDPLERYEYKVAWSPEDNAYIGRVTEFRSLAAHGDTQEAALESIKATVEVAIEALKAKGRDVPAPLWERKYSGRLNLRMPEELHHRLANEAENHGVSLNTWIVQQLIRN